MPDDPTGGPTDASRRGHDEVQAAARQHDHDRTLAAIHDLESALASAGTGERTGAWTRQVLAALTTLSEAMQREQRHAGEPDSLLADIARSTPRLRHRAHGLRAQYGQLATSIASVTDHLERTPLAAVDVADLRHQLGWLLTALRYHRGRESDLIYEALGLDDGGTEGR